MSTVYERKSEFKEMVKFFNYECVKCCGKSNLINVERDHIYPKRWGGSDELINIQPLCALCNIQKDSDITDYRIKYANEHNLIIPKKWISHYPIKHNAK